MAIVLGAVMARSSPARACSPAVIDGDTAALPDAWRGALEALVAATAREGQPWSCTGARVSLLPPIGDGPATLLVEDTPGHMRMRPVAAPEDLVPLGEALLATTMVTEPRSGEATPPIAPIPPAAPPAPAGDPPTRPYRVPDSGAASKPGTRGERPLLVDALAGARYSGPAKAFWAGGALRGTLLADAWSLGVWARYEASVALLEPGRAALSSASVGLSGGHRIFASPFALYASIEPSLALVSEEAGRHESHVEADKVDARLGARLDAMLPVVAPFRAVASFEGEVAPQAIFGSAASRQIDSRLPALPAFMLGASVGVELAVR